MPDSTTVTIQKRGNRLGQVKYKAFILVQDVVIDGWGNTPEEAEEDLKMRCGVVLMKNDPEFQKEVEKLMEGLPANKKNEVVMIALKNKLSSNNKKNDL